MKFNSLFNIREEVTEEILELLNETTLGTNGAMYRHLDTSTRVKEIDAPLFLTMERNGKVLGNVTFCQRGEHWYIRYFAFRSFLQRRKKSKSNDKGNSILKRELSTFFDKAFEGSSGRKPIQSMYAYIDPNNDRSKWMSENFGFKTIAKLSTQSFSRVSPKKSECLVEINNWGEVKPIVEQNFKAHCYYFDVHCSKPPYYGIKDEGGELLAFARFTAVQWEIVRMPGKMGGFLTKTIPFIPFLNRIIRPKNHQFLVPDIVWSKNKDAQLLNELFEGVLALKNQHLILWWVDQQDPYYKAVQSKIKWGILHKMIGASPVDVVQKTQSTTTNEMKTPVFVSAIDMV